ncbi:PD-(D/E)XK nuclease family protein [Heyndrickxia oleronia]|uniref:PD-(D/E)XK nuclease family protein n=1 Tax=Heyndrickxia oleronia TaxID=38875 RepID=UPI00203CD1A2|nr:PD-(D/E)XK nuclease family protein [Heyndrickxia oleronia]MCM3240744.1 PD-(D/E)XK nuclease family protein [Heyndrickxia oleronia]
MAIMTYSFSRLTLFQECPYRFYLRYIEKREEPVTEPLAMGKAVHLAIELMLKGHSLDQALFEAEMDCPILIDPMELRNLVEKAPIEMGAGLKSGVEIEKYFKLPLSNADDAPCIQGYIDLVETVFGCIEFTDWKTNRMIYSPMDTMQLPLYAWALSKIYKTFDIVGSLFFLRYFKKAKKRMSFSKREMENARKWAEDTAIQIENRLFLLEIGEPVEKLFPYQMNPYCKHCSFAGECLLKNEKEIFGGILYANSCK